MRSVLAGLLGFVTLGLIIVTVALVWSDSQLIAQDQFVRLTAPLAADPAVQEVLVTQSVALIGRRIAAGTSLGATTQTVLMRQIERNVRAEIAAPGFGEVWTAVVRRTHDGLLASLAAAGAGNLFIVDGRLTADLTPLAPVVARRLAAAGLSVTIDPTATYEITLLDAPRLVAVLGQAYRLHQALPALVVACPLLFGLTLLIAPSRASALIWLSAWLVLAMALLVAGSFRAPDLLARLTSGGPYQALTTATAAVLLPSLRLTLGLVAAAGLVLIIIGLFTRLAARR